MTQGGQHRSRLAGLKALLFLLACPISTAFGQPISGHSLALFKQWEQLQVQHFEGKASYSQTTRVDDTTLTHYLAPSSGEACSSYFLTLSNLDEDTTLSFDDIGGICRATLTNTAVGVHLLQISKADSLGAMTPVGQSTLSLSYDTQEVFISLRNNDEQGQLSLLPWPNSNSENVDISWWRRAFGWLPGIANAKSIKQRESAARPQWQWLDKQCQRTAPDSQHAAALFHLYQPGSDYQYNADEYRVMTRCALNQQWPTVAAEFLAEWRIVGGADRERVAAELSLAELQYRIGDYHAVVDTLRPRNFKRLNRVKAAHFLSMALIALEQYGDAISLLEHGTHLATQHDTQAMELNDDPSLFMRYNLATALMLDGRRNDGLAVLDALGQHPSNSPLSAALIERANLALGWQLIKDGKGASAAPVFERILVGSPFARRATLGLGWSWTIAPGERQERTAETVHLKQETRSVAILRALYQNKKISCQEYREAVQDNSVCSQEKYFSQAEEESEAQRSNNAVQLWAHLLEQDFTDIVGIETSIQLSKELGKQNHFEPANQVLSNAIAAIDSQRRSIALWQGTPESPTDSDGTVMPRAIQLWWLGAEPTLLRNTLSNIALINQHYSSNGSLQARGLKTDIQQQLDSLLVGRTKEYLTNLDSYQSAAYYLSGQLLDRSQQLQTSFELLPPLSTSAPSKPAAN